LSNPEGILLFPVIYFNPPTVEVDLEQLLRRTAHVAGEQACGIERPVLRNVVSSRPRRSGVAGKTPKRV